MNKLSMLVGGLVLLFSSLASGAEKLEYQIKVLNVDFGNATLYASEERLYGEMKTNDKWGSLYAVDNKMATWLSPEDLPKKTEIVYRKPSKVIKFEFFFTAMNNVKVKFSKPHKNPKSYVKKTKGEVYDFLTMLAVMRKRVGTDADAFSVITGRKIYDVVFTKQKDQSVNTLLGTREATVYDVVVTRPGNFRQEMRVWFEKNPDATPLKLAGKTKLGTFDVSILKRSLNTNQESYQK